jgi:hypothetical protein
LRWLATLQTQKIIHVPPFSFNEQLPSNHPLLLYMLRVSTPPFHPDIDLVEMMKLVNLIAGQDLDPHISCRCGQLQPDCYKAKLGFLGLYYFKAYQYLSPENQEKVPIPLPVKTVDARRAGTEDDNKELSKLRQYIAKLEADLLVASNGWKSVGASIGPTIARMAEHDRAIEGYKKAAAVMISELDVARSNLRGTRLKLDLKRNELDSTKSELNATTTKLHMTEDELEVRKTQLTYLETQRKETEEAMRAQKLDLDSRTSELSATKTQLALTEQRFEETVKSIKELAARNPLLWGDYDTTGGKSTP